jgi:hypothetical protein
MSHLAFTFDPSQRIQSKFPLISTKDSIYNILIVISQRPTIVNPKLASLNYYSLTFQSLVNSNRHCHSTPQSTMCTLEALHSSSCTCNLTPTKCQTQHKLANQHIAIINKLHASSSLHLNHPTTKLF